MFGSINEKKIKKMMGKLEKENPDLVKITLEYFLKWWEVRSNISKKIDKNEFELNDLMQFHEFCIIYKDHLIFNSELFNRYKIDWKIQEKYLINDIKFCESHALFKIKIGEVEKDMTSQLETKRKREERVFKKRGNPDGFVNDELINKGKKKNE